MTLGEYALRLHYALIQENSATETSMDLSRITGEAVRDRALTSTEVAIIALVLTAYGKGAGRI